MLDEADHLFVGVKQSTRAVKEGSAVKAYVARDADQMILDEFTSLCAAKHVPVTYVPTMKQLGEQCNITVGAAVAVYARC